MDEFRLEMFWNEIPVGKENALDYDSLVDLWRMSARQVRRVLHELSLYDNGDDYILVRSAKGKGFYRTDDEATIKAYRRECLNKGKSIFAPVKKCNRILRADDMQGNFINNLRGARIAKGLKQSDVCKFMKYYDPAFNASLLSKMENGICLPNYYQVARLAEIYGVKPSDLVNGWMYA